MAVTASPRLPMVCVLAEPAVRSGLRMAADKLLTASLVNLAAAVVSAAALPGVADSTPGSSDAVQLGDVSKTDTEPSSEGRNAELVVS